MKRQNLPPNSYLLLFAFACAAIPRSIVAELKQPRYLHAGDQRWLRQYARMDDAVPARPVEPASPQTRRTRSTPHHSLGSPIIWV
jgi:hypothetical protein